MLSYQLKGFNFQRPILKSIYLIKSTHLTLQDFNLDANPSLHTPLAPLKKIRIAPQVFTRPNQLGRKEIRLLEFYPKE